MGCNWILAVFQHAFYRDHRRGEGREEEAQYVGALNLFNDQVELCGASLLRRLNCEIPINHRLVDEVVESRPIVVWKRSSRQSTSQPEQPQSDVDSGRRI